MALPRALIVLSGVLEDGTNRGRLVPTNPREPLRIIRGNSYTVRVMALLAGGSPLPIVAGQTFALTIGPPVTRDFVPLLQKSGTPNLSIPPIPSGTAIDFTIDPADYKPALLSGYYKYEVIMADGSGHRTHLKPTSPCYVEPAVAMF